MSKESNGQEQAALAATPCSVENVSRQVIEKQLLTALDDKSRVAILASEDDLIMLITALGIAEKHRFHKDYLAFRLDLEQLRREAFPPNDKLRHGGENQ